jgi:hypothetical protein
MANKDSRSGGKFTGNHTSLIPLAARVCDVLHTCSAVQKISPGFIKAGLKSVQGKRRIKMTESKGGLLLSVRDNASHQEVFVYSNDANITRQVVVECARNLHISITSVKNSEELTQSRSVV